MIVKNATLYDPVNKKFTCRNLLIDKGVILEDDLTVDSLPNDPEVYDLTGKYLYPSFIDSHCHLVGTGKSVVLPNLETCNHRNDLIACLEKNTEHFVMLRGWDDNKLGFIPDRSFLDQTNPDNSILLVRRCGHVATVNSKCISEFTLESMDGIDESDISKGILLERALFLTTRKINFSPSNEIKYFEAGAEYFLNNGITAVHSEDWNIHNIENMGLFLSTQKNIRLSESICIGNKQELLTWVKLRNSLKQSPFSNFTFIKLYLDGSLGGETAYLKDPYYQKNNRGTLYFSEQELTELLKIAETESISVKIHIIGDGALEVALNSFSHTLTPGNPLRHKLVHVQIASQDQLKKILDLNLNVAIQPRFLTSDKIIAPLKLGKERFKEIGYPFKKMHELGIRLSFSSDSPIEKGNPFLTFQSSDEWLDRKTAFTYYTQEAAKSVFQENSLGSLVKGKLADAFICSKDIFSIPTDHLDEIKPESVLLNGQWIDF